MEKVPIMEELALSQGTQTTCDNLTEGANSFLDLILSSVYNLLSGILSSQTHLEATGK